MSDHVRIFDTTLRDGEQSPGATMTSAEKLEVAKALARLGVDVIEAGFPAASPDDLAAVRTIAAQVGTTLAVGTEPPIICGLARAARPDIDRAWEGVRAAKRPRIHTFLATSDLHMQHKLRMTRAEVKARVAEMVGYARSLCADIEFSPEDAGRSDPAFLYEVLEIAIRAGATTLNIPDTVGYTTPDEFGALIAGIRAHVPGAKDVILSVHCHDDLGLATANAIAGILAGARQAERHRLVVVRAGLAAGQPELPDPRDEEHLVVHGQPEGDAEQQHRHVGHQGAGRRRTQRTEMSLLEDPHQCTERRRQRQHVEHQRLQRQHHRAGEQEQQHEGDDRDDAEHQRQPGGDGVHAVGVDLAEPGQLDRAVTGGGQRPQLLELMVGRLGVQRGGARDGEERLAAGESGGRRRRRGAQPLDEGAGRRGDGGDVGDLRGDLRGVGLQAPLIEALGVGEHDGHR